MTEEPQSPPNVERLERRALVISSLGALLLAGLGIGFAIHSGSDAILLDGVFSALGFLLALMTLKVSRLVRLPDDAVFQYGYAHFAPLMNVLKSLVMSVLCFFALLSAISTLLSGGEAMELGSALLYAVLATLIGAALFVYLRGAARRSGSVLVALDAKAAQLDLFLSFAVLASFTLGWLIVGTPMERYIDYLDPLVVTVLCLVALPTPLKVLWENGREALLLAPAPELQATVVQLIRGAVGEFPITDCKIRMLKLGNVLAITMHLRPADDAKIEGIADLDRVRHAIEDALAALEYQIGLDVIFVGDMKLAR